MSIINLHVEKLESINNEFKNLSDVLSDNYYNELERELNSIKNNIRNERVHSSINTIIEQFRNIKNDTSIDLKKLTDFLENQLKSYTYSEIELEQAILNVINKMSYFVSVVNGTCVGDPNYPDVSDSSYREIMKERATLEHGPHENVPSPSDPDYYEIMEERRKLEGL